MLIRSLIVILGFWLQACDQPDEPVAGAVSGLSGFWQGIIKTVSGSSEQVTDITLNLDSNETFTLTKIRTQDEATGTYDEFPQLRSLTLRVEASQVEELALAGGIRDFEYQLFDGELLLNSRDSIVRLKRPKEGDAEALNTVWQCLQDQLSWQLTFAGGQFVLYLENLDGASVFMKGGYSVESRDDDEAEQRIVLFVEDAQPVRAFDQLTGTMTYEDGFVVRIDLTPQKQSGETLGAMECMQLPSS
ncbi:hypothetical protein [Pseudobacteriovorax antillogorgiicola]|uniref:Uncharacterized protein n=1 Tax=Pseudobacteriovorax antillogorgiicola TaxID=1513793 RepID=A0A1Y6CHW7_9BACT|nr:hypothetical protein [Pseudobacteriovorax antillogorgiicola]TCS46671.1 hypothetical protein EDD56_12347 [Pseudobacteriovorax antillogorgiicola]SMF66629.1 hypothetical protein SAMN06296036_12347 [Pseudobacteriovorax antillogorgiicola]